MQRKGRSKFQRPKISLSITFSNNATLIGRPRGVTSILSSRSPKFCLQKHRWQVSQILPFEFQIYDPKICVVHLWILMGGVFSYFLVPFEVTSKQKNIRLSFTGIMSKFLLLGVPELSKFFLLFGDLTPNFASKLEARSKPSPPPPTS